MSIRSKIQVLLNRLIKKTYWYNNVAFGDCKKFWNHNTFDLDVVNLGSSSAKAAFCYSSFTGIKAANWAMAPQSLLADYEILRNYCCYLKKGATVLISICPFSSLGGSCNDLPDKYYTILNVASIPNASFRRQQQQNQIMKNPWLYFPVSQLFSYCHVNSQKKGFTDYENDARIRLDGWQKEFSILDFSNPLSLINKDSYYDGIQMLRRLVEFCVEHDFNPVFVLPPVHKSLQYRYSLSMKGFFIDSFVNEASNGNVLFLDYFYDNRFTSDMFHDSFLLNNKGAAIFTKIVLTDLNII